MSLTRLHRTISEVRRLAEDDGAVALAVKAPGYTDYLCIGFDDREHTLAAGGEAFVFTEYGYSRVQGGSIAARGKIRAFKVSAPAGWRRRPPERQAGQRSA